MKNFQKKRPEIQPLDHLILTYFWMLRSINGYFTRRLLGESANKDKPFIFTTRKINDDYLFDRFWILGPVKDS